MHYPLLRAHSPWPQGTSSRFEEEEEPAAKRAAVYLCGKGCRFAVALAADAVPPALWDCRCGGTAHLEGTPPPQGAERAFPGVWDRYDRPRAVRPGFGYVLQRRSWDELEALLAERIQALRGGAP